LHKKRPISHRMILRPIAKVFEWNEQREMWKELKNL
jgi:hypothetical protein